VIPLNQLIPECLLALGGAFLLGNLAAYIRLRPAWRDAKRARGGRAAEQRPRTVANGTAGASPAPETGTASSGATEPAGGTTARGLGTAEAAEGATEAGRGAAERGRDTAGPSRRTPRTGTRHSTARRGSGATRAGTARTVGADSGASRTRVTKAVDPKPSGSRPVGGKRPAQKASSGTKLPSRARVLANMVIGLVITLAALATLIRG
jgi:hypothetical protein